MADPNNSLAALFGWGNNSGSSGVMQNSNTIVPGMQWKNQMPAMGGDISAANSGGSPGFSLWGGTDENGIKTNSGAALGLGAAQGLFKGWMGLQQLGMAKDQLKENKRQFNMNWGAQKTTTNNALHQNQQFRNAVNPDSQPVDQYMDKWGVK